MELSKQDAEREVLRRWSQLPPHQRLSYEDAEAYAKRLDAELDFRTMTSKEKLIAAWLIREIDRVNRAPDRTEARAA